MLLHENRWWRARKSLSTAALALFIGCVGGSCGDPPEPCGGSCWDPPEPCGCHDREPCDRADGTTGMCFASGTLCSCEPLDCMTLAHPKLEQPGCTTSLDCPQPGYCSAGCECVQLTGDPKQDYVDSISTNIVTFTNSVIDLVEFGATRHLLDQLTQTELFGNSVYDCGDSQPNLRVVCADDASVFPVADMWVATMVLAEAVPLADSTHSFIYSLVLDSDGDPANNWKFVPPYDWDLFQGADRWDQLIWDHKAQTWSVTVTQVDASQNTTTVTSAVRVAIEGDRITFFVPSEEITATTPGYRLTAFGHDGNFSASDRGADVNGADPTEPLSTPN